jgi:hypothetical protein
VSSAVIQGEGPRRCCPSFASAGAQSASDVINFSGLVAHEAPRVRQGALRLDV